VIIFECVLFDAHQADKPMLEQIVMKHFHRSWVAAISASAVGWPLASLSSAGVIADAGATIFGNTLIVASMVMRRWTAAAVAVALVSVWWFVWPMWGDATRGGPPSGALIGTVAGGCTLLGVLLLRRRDRWPRRPWLAELEADERDRCFMYAVFHGHTTLALMSLTAVLMQGLNMLFGS